MRTICGTSFQCLITLFPHNYKNVIKYTKVLMTLDYNVLTKSNICEMYSVIII